MTMNDENINIKNNIFNVCRLSGKYPPIDEGYGKNNKWYINLDIINLKEFIQKYGRVRITTFSEIIILDDWEE